LQVLADDLDRRGRICRRDMRVGDEESLKIRGIWLGEWRANDIIEVNEDGEVVE